MNINTIWQGADNLIKMSIMPVDIDEIICIGTGASVAQVQGNLADIPVIYIKVLFAIHIAIICLNQMT